MKTAVLVLFLAAVVASAAVESGYISVLNNGAYVAKFKVDYKVNGKQSTEESGDFTLGVTKTIRIPEGATDVYVKTELYWFFSSTTDVFSETFPGPVKRCYKIWGTTLMSSWSQIGC